MVIVNPKLRRVFFASAAMLLLFLASYHAFVPELSNTILIYVVIGFLVSLLLPVIGELFPKKLNLAASPEELQQIRRSRSLRVFIISLVVCLAGTAALAYGDKLGALAITFGIAFLICGFLLRIGLVQPSEILNRRM